ncbi:MAG: NDP-sugar synthase [Spirochaetes bacterium]|nr:NDP-sugar synthase [Spirochaetota bacterium]
MKGFIFAAGYGERLRPLTDSTPKSLLPVFNLPSICYAVLFLKKAGIDHIVCNLHYRSEDIIDYFRANDYFGVRIDFSVEEEILGTGGGFKKCESLIGDSEVMLINTDIIMDLDPQSLIESHRKNGFPATLVLRRTEMASAIGPVGIEGNRVIDFKNFLGTGGKSAYIYTGSGIVSPAIFKYLTNEFSSIVYTGYIDLIKYHSVGFYEHQGYWYDTGTIESYLNVHVELLKKVDELREQMSQILGLVPEIISADAEIAESSGIMDSIIGKGAIIGEGVLIQRSVILPHAVVRKNSVIRNSVVFEDQVINKDFTK